MTAQDKEMLEVLESLAVWLVNDDAVSNNRLDVADYCNYLTAIRYAISKIRGG